MKQIKHWIVTALLLPLDYFASGILYQMPGMTISARCGIALKSNEKGVRGYLLRLLGKGLNRIDEGHCAGAILGDIRRVNRTLDRLTPWAE